MITMSDRFVPAIPALPTIPAVPALPRVEVRPRCGWIRRGVVVKPRG
ncbi:hypothetical protein [Crossiella equi]|nr:hypothetical protein [Crossiella equi]